MTDRDLNRLLRQLSQDPEPDPMHKRLIEIYRRWLREKKGGTKQPLDS